jgi:hypothetical protein
MKHHKNTMLIVGVLAVAVLGYLYFSQTPAAAATPATPAKTS